MSEVYYLSQPKLNSPKLIAAWPGVGQVALISLRYLKEELRAIEFAQLNMRECFELGGVLIEDNIIQPFRFPQGIFYYWQNPQGEHDLILFESEGQPSYKAYELGNKVLDIAQGLEAEMVITFAAALVSEPPVKPRVWAASSSPSLCRELEKYGAALKGDFYIAGMNGGLLAIAQERNMEALCLLGESLRDFPHREDYLAALSILQVLSNYLDLPINLDRLRSLAKKSQEELEEMLMTRRKEFIENFTVPIWERDEENS